MAAMVGLWARRAAVLVFIAGAGLLSAPVQSLAAEAAPAPDTSRLLVFFHIENDSIISPKNTDAYYTSGLRAGFVSGTQDVPRFLQSWANDLFGPGRQRLTFDLTQGIFTPWFDHLYVPVPGDRPYAGIFLGTVGLNHETDTTRTALSLGLGVVGPNALAEQVQNGWHQVIGAPPANGWGTQLRNEPAFQITASRTWRRELGRAGPLCFDVLPQLVAGGGNVRVYGLAGATLRMGQGLESDFGAARILPGLSGGDAYTWPGHVAWYVFIGADGQAVAHDITLDGNTFVPGPAFGNASVRRLPGVAEMQAGFAILTKWGRVTYTNVFQTAEFAHQRGGLFEFGSLSLSARF